MPTPSLFPHHAGDGSPRPADRQRRRLLGGGAAWAGTLALAGCQTAPFGAADSESRTPAAMTPDRPEPTGPLSDAALVNDLAQRSFRYFWELGDPATGLIPDRWPTPSFASVAAVGFGLTAYPIAAARGWVPREQAAERARATLRFFHDAPQGPEARGNTGYKGFYYHFLDMRSGLRYGRVELSTVDTAILLAGALFCAAWFDGPGVPETEIRRLAEALYARVDWTWAQVRPPSIALGWHPETGFIRADWKGYNESMIVYLLALGSPTHPVSPQAWEVWCSTYGKSWGEAQGYSHLRFPPLFGHQFSHLWVDFRGLRDAYMRERGLDYFENTQRATQAQRAYAIANPEGWAGYGPDVWGITACDGPADVRRLFGGKMRRFMSYAGRGMAEYDDGTIAPYGAASAVPFTPDIALPALQAMHRRYGTAIYGRYGFVAFNPSFQFEDVRLLHGRLVRDLGWVDTDWLGIETGPVLGLLANHQDGIVWSTLQRVPALQRGLQRAGFSGGWLA